MHNYCSGLARSLHVHDCTPMVTDSASEFLITAVATLHFEYTTVTCMYNAGPKESAQCMQDSQLICYHQEDNSVKYA